MSTKYREKIQALIDAREKATQGEWKRLEDGDQHRIEVESSPRITTDQICKLTYFYDNKEYMARQNFEFIVLAANQSADMARDLLRAIEVIEKYKTQSLPVNVAPGDKWEDIFPAAAFLEKLEAPTGVGKL